MGIFFSNPENVSGSDCIPFTNMRITLHNVYAVRPGVVSTLEEVQYTGGYH